MERGRSSSLPPGGNPFWSNMAQLEWQVRTHRPVELPVPGDDAEVELELEEGEPIADGSQGDGNRGREGRRMIRSDRFSTPASWTDAGGSNGRDLLDGRSEGMRTAGRLPEESPGLQGEQGFGLQQDVGRTQGPHPAEEMSGDPDGLQRSLERALMEKLLEDNARLQEELASLKKDRLEELRGGETSQWSEVTENPPQPSMEVFSPRPPPTRKNEMWHQQRHTPNGTAVPLGPPPDHEVPPWPLDASEASAVEGSLKWLGPQSIGIGRRSRLHDEAFGGGADRPRGQLFEQEVGGGAGRPRQDREEQGTMSDVMSSMQARTFWLEQELKSMKNMLDRQGSGKFQSDYWKQPVQHHGRDHHDGGCHQVPLSRADHGGLCQQAPQGRADHGGVCEQAPQGRADGAELLGGGRAVHGTVLGVQRPHDEECQGDHEGLRQVDDLFDGCYQTDRQGHQQLHNRGLCDPAEQKRSNEK